MASNACVGCVDGKSIQLGVLRVCFMSPGAEGFAEHQSSGLRFDSHFLVRTSRLMSSHRPRFIVEHVVEGNVIVLSSLCCGRCCGAKFYEIW